MEIITFEIESMSKFQLSMVEFPELSSHKPLIQKGINILKDHTPKILRYLSRQHILADLQKYKIILKMPTTLNNNHIKETFNSWIHKEMTKRLGYVIIEGIVLPFTPFLALLPGPNIFFYIPALLFYFHLRSYLGLRKVHANELDIEVEHG